MKTIFNRRLRHMEIYNNSYYKKMLCSWDICDDYYYLSYQDFVRQYYQSMKGKKVNGYTIHVSYLYYYKVYLMK